MNHNALVGCWMVKIGILDTIVEWVVEKFSYFCSLHFSYISLPSFIIGLSEKRWLWNRNSHKSNRFESQQQFTQVKAHQYNKTNFISHDIVYCFAFFFAEAIFIRFTCDAMKKNWSKYCLWLLFNPEKL